MVEVKAVYTDGGVIGKNPSRDGGTWAFVHVGGDGRLYRLEKGIVTPADVGLPTVTNNMTELLAMLHALEALPVGWSGSVYTDSQITLYRAMRPWTSKFDGITNGLRERLVAARERIGHVTFHLLGGHPDRGDAAGTWKTTGVRLRDGRSCSKWNVMCDAACNEMVDQWRANQATAGASK